MRARTNPDRFGIALTLALALTISTTAMGETVGLQMPAYETRILDNGLTLLLMQHDTVPLVSFEFWIDAGAALDSRGREGLAALTVDALRKGAGDRDAAALAEALDFLGARLNSSTNSDRARISLNVLKKDFDLGLELLADMVLRPTFDEAEVRKLADQMAESVIQGKENPRRVLGDYHRAHVFADHPYGNPVDGTETSMSGLDRDDVAGFYRDWLGADRAVLAVVGDLDADAETKLRAAFENMPRAAKSTPGITEPVRPAGRQVLLVNKNDTPQTWFMIGNVGPAWGDPDFAATELVRTIFGGRFTSWLNTTLRIEAGLTYGASFSISRQRAAGLGHISSFTATETTKDALDLALAQLDRLHDEGIAEKDLDSAKAYLKGQLPYRYETADGLATILCQLQFYGMDRSFVDGLFEEIDGVSLSDCQRVIQRHFQRDDLVFTTIGVESAVGEILAEYGTVSVRQNDEPGFHLQTTSSVNR